MDKKTFWGSIVGLLIVGVGSIVVCIMKFYAGLLVILPGAFPHVINIVRWFKMKK